MSSAEKVIEFLGLGTVAYLVAMYLWPRRGLPDRQHETIDNTHGPPPVIRQPDNGNGPYGYFRNFWDSITDTKIYHDPSIL